MGEWLAGYHTGRITPCCKGLEKISVAADDMNRDGPRAIFTCDLWIGLVVAEDDDKCAVIDVLFEIGFDDLELIGNRSYVGLASLA